MIIEFKKPDIKNESQERAIKRRPGRLARWKDKDGDYIDRQGRKIKDPRVISELDRITAIPREKRNTKDQIRLGRLRRDGDDARAKNKLVTVEKKEPTQETLSDINTAGTAPTTAELVQNIIANIYSGLNPIEAIKKNNYSPMKFFKELDKEQNFQLKKEYFSAREAYAEFCLYRREQLEKDLLSGNIDSSTYSALANDYKFLASKCFPKMYGDKVTLETEVKHNVSLSVNNDKVLQLNEMLNAPKLLDSKVTDAEFEEVKD